MRAHGPEVVNRQAPQECLVGALCFAVCIHKEKPIEGVDKDALAEPNSIVKGADACAHAMSHGIVRDKRILLVNEMWVSWRW